MSSQSVVPKKRPGPAPTGKGAQVQVRLQPDALEAVDQFCAAWNQPVTRPQAIRMLLNEGLRKHGYLADRAEPKS